MFKLLFVSFVSVFFVVSTCCGQGSNSEPESAVQFEKMIRPMLERYCIDCHSKGEMKDLDFLEAKTPVDVDGLRDAYAAVWTQMENRTMPPGDSKQPTDTERKMVADWIKKALDLKPVDFERISQYVVAICEDTKGNLWFGTVSDGAARYDGKSLAYFSTKNGLCGDTVTSIAEDKEGNIWFGTHTGASRYDGKSFTNFSSTEGLHGAGCKFLVDKKGNIWAGTNHGAFRYNSSSFSKFDIPTPSIVGRTYKWEVGKVWSLIEDSKGNIWFGRDGFGACRFDGKSFHHLTKKDGLCSNNVSNMVEDKQGNFWFGCLSSDIPEYVDEGGLCRYDGKSFTKYPEIQGLSENDIYTIHEEKAGMIWIGATGVGAYRYNGKTFTLFDQTDKQFWTRYFGVQSMKEDRNGTLWFGFSGGLFRFNGQSFFNIKKDGPWK